MQQYFLTPETLLVLCIVAVVIFLQAKAFMQNRKRMNDFGSIFSQKDTWGVYHDNNNIASGITGHGNDVLNSIVHAINKYLGNSRGSVIDFSLLKDAVDRNCDAVEDEINAQMPIPLYYGLAGTMGGVIAGLVFMLGRGTIPTLLGGSGGQGFGAAANGVNDLLTGVAFAMIASVAGIIMTTWNTRYFKEKKMLEERGKNDFIVWMQANLLPDLPTDVGDAMMNMVSNLNRFNTTFATNNEQLQGTLSKIGSLYQDQSQILKLLHDIDMQKMATANVKVLHELRDCTGRLEDFNDYLTAVKGYATEIRKFREQLAKEQERLYVLEEIRDFFRNHGYKDALAKAITDSDDSLRTALRNLQEATSGNMDTMSRTLTQQTDTFRQVSKEMQDAFETQLRHFPQLEDQIKQIAEIPKQLEKLAKEIESSNARTANSINYALQNIRVEFGSNNMHVSSRFPAWLPALLAIIALFAAMPYIVKAFQFLNEAF